LSSLGNKNVVNVKSKEAFFKKERKEEEMKKNG